METDLITTFTTKERANAIASSIELLRKGEVVALPTETVYGLAANALDSIAVAKIFEAKERPRFDPLIVHLPDRDWLEKIVKIPQQDQKLILRLIEKFWPGPFTIVLPKREVVPDIVTAGLDTLAVRMSAHSIFAEIVREFGQPLAAPSANRFGRVSPTIARHVLDELDGRIPLIVDGGPTAHGIESTIIAIQSGQIVILRRGPITDEQLLAFGEIVVASSNHKVIAPGQLPSHYAPRTPLRVVDQISSFQPNKRSALLAWSPTKGDERFVAIRNLSERQDLREAAANLFRFLRELDALNVDLIVAERLPLHGLGAAINDRLKRASGRDD